MEKMISGESTRRISFGFKPKLFLTIVSFLLVHTLAMAQEVSVSGVVTTETNEPLPGVSIVIDGTTQGTITDINGNYNLKVNKGDALIFSFIGFVNQKQTIETAGALDVVLKEDVASLNEVVVVGYGKQSRATMTNAVTTIKTEAIENIVYSNASQALQGRVAGLRVVNKSGQPGSSPEIILRGGSSINGSSSPLYIVDGVERTEINALRSDDIESMQVLKDATSTAVYGARGSNGVVIITTKTGKLGKSQVNYKYRLGFSTFRDENFRQIGGEDYIRNARLGQLNATLLNSSIPNGDVRAASLSKLDDGNSYGTGNSLEDNRLFTTMLLNDDNKDLLNSGWSQMEDPVTGETIIFQDTDWYDVNYQTGVRQEHSIDMSGADEKSSYYMSLGMLSDEGILVNTNYDVYTMVLNADRKLSDTFRAFGKLNFSHEMKDQPSGFSSTNFDSGAHMRNMILRSPNMAPTTKLTFADGSYAPGVNQMMANPLYVDEHLVRDQRKTRWTALFGFDWDITPELNFSPKGSVYNVTTLENSSNDAYLSGTSLNSDRHKRTVNKVNWIKQFDGVLTYTKTLAEKHNLNATGVASYRSEDYFYSNSATQGSPTDIIETLNGGTEAFQVPTSSTWKDVVIGFVGRVVYDYDKRYLFQASVRRDGSSRFGSDNQWGTFMGISGGWNIHNEDFFHNISMGGALSRLKVRASYGETGNNSNLGKYTWQGKYATLAYGGMGGTYKFEDKNESGLSNNALRWETTKTFDVGMDLGLFNDRVSLLVDYYNRKTVDLLQDLSLPANTGFTKIKTNYAQLGNNGVELELNGRILDKANFSWDMGINYSYNITKVLKLPDNGVDNNRIGGIEVADPNDPSKTIWVGGYQEDQELGLQYAYVSEGVYGSWEEAVADGIVDTKANGGKGRYVMDADYMVIDTNGDGSITSADRVTKGGGDVKWADLNDDGVINSLDRKYMGRANAPHTGGIINTIKYKNLSLRINLDYAWGHVVYDYESRYRNGRYTANISMMPGMNDMWTPTNTSSNYAQYYASGDPMGNWNRGSSNMYYKGDYLCIRDITLNYQLPQKWFDKFFLSGASTYVTGQNLYYFTEYPGYQPEKGGVSDQNNFQYPMPRIITMGINLSF